MESKSSRIAAFEEAVMTYIEKMLTIENNLSAAKIEALAKLTESIRG